MAGRIENLKPWRKGVSGNPGGRPKRKLLTEELERLLGQEAPNAPDKTWAAVIAEALLSKARKGDVRAISELANRVEGKPLQAVELDLDQDEDPGERLSELLASIQERISEHGN